MSNQDKVNVKIGFPVGTILTLIFVTLKLTNYIDWSWWWVLSPIWIPVGILLAVLIILLIIRGIVK